jgi:hypothetical protein
MPEVIALLSPFEAEHRAEPGFAYLLGIALIRAERQDPRGPLQGVPWH